MRSELERRALLRPRGYLRLHAPGLPGDLRSSLAALADEAGASLDGSEASLAELLAEGRGSPKTAIVLPLGLFNPALIDDTLEVVALE